MVQTRSNDGGGSSSDHIAAQLAAITAKLESIETLKEDVAALKNKSHERSGSGFGRYEEGETCWNNYRTHRPYNKIDFPKYSEGDPRGWILKAEKYFRYYNIPDCEKVDIASMHLEGDALDLYSWLSNDQPISFWEELVQALTKNFGPPEFRNPDEHLCGIKQTGSVHEYRQEFAKRSSRVSDWPEHCLLGVFLNGLKEELKADVRIHKPRTVYNAMSLALEFESKTGPNQKGRHSQITVAAKENQTGTVSTGDMTPTPFRISETEKQARYVKGECFRCGEKFSPGHRCKTGSLLALEADDQNVKIIPEGDEEAAEAAEISLNAITGMPHHSTLVVPGSIKAAKISVLIDCGSTHNFIKDSLVPKIDLLTHEVVPFGVRIGNGDIIRCNRVCKDVTLHLTDLQIIQDFYPFSLGAADVILGIQWLATLNTVHANWKEMFMKFNVDGKDYQLQGRPPDIRQPVALRQLIIETVGDRTAWPAATFANTRLEDKSSLRTGSIDTKPKLVELVGGNKFKF